MNKDFIKIGHRGAKGYIAENTIESFKRAIEIGVDAIEIDVQLCKTGELIVFHDNRVDRLSNGSGMVCELDFDYLSSLDVGNGSIIPTLEETLDFIDNRLLINIELKGMGTSKATYDIVDFYIRNRNWDKGNFLISSFNHIELKAYKKLDSEMKIGVLLSCIPTDYALIAEKMGAYSINLSIEFISQEFIDDAHKRGLLVLVYTVNSTDDILRLKSMGVDGIFSDFPDLL